MAVLQGFKPPPGAKFSADAEKVFDIVTSNNSKRTDVVFMSTKTFLSRMPRGQKKLRVRRCKK